MKTFPTIDADADDAARGLLLRTTDGFMAVFSLVAREWAGLRRELSQINLGEPGYQEDLEVRK